MALLPPARLARVVALPPGFAELAADALADGHRLLEVLREDWEAGSMRFDGPGEALFVVGSGADLLGIGGLTRDPYTPDVGTGRVRRLYVRRAARRIGTGTALVRAIAAEATAAGLGRLRVRAPPAAFAFYEACGFLRAIGERSATHILPLSAGVPGTP
jgi:GNAT superfamily N-acetyltransferase